VLHAEYEWTNEKLPDDDDIHAGDVNGETPPVHIATNIEAAEKYTHHDKHRSSPTAQGDQGCDKYAS